jgi:uncharacterized membrane protein
MDGEQIYIIILRILHIAGAMLWFGGGVFIIYVLDPTVELAKEDGTRFMHLLNRQRQFTALMPAASGTTLLAGLLLYERVSAGFNSDWMSSRPGMVLSIGAVAGTIAFITGAVFRSRIDKKRVSIGEAIYQANNRPTPEQLQELGELGESADVVNRVMMFSIVIALIAMSSAQYMY